MQRTTSVKIVIGLMAVAMSWGCSRTEDASVNPRPSASSVVREFHGDLLEMVRNFASEIPGRDSEGYDRPERAQAAGMAQVTEIMRGGDVSRASDLALPYDYSVVRYTDAATKTSLLVLAEHQAPDGSWPHGWGLYIQSPESDSRVIVEVPHPVADVNTEVVGTQLFRVLGAGDLLVAGAERDANDDGSADVAHASGSVFEEVHRAVLTEGSTVIQVHGWDPASHPEIDADVVVSSGVATASPVAARISEELAAAGIRTCLYDGTACRALAATTNVQGQSTRDAGAEFVHLELSSDLRDKKGQVTRLVDAIARALS